MSEQLKIGDAVRPKPGVDPLVCGSGSYPFAVVASVDPFVLVSEEGDMLWSAPEKASDFEAIAPASEVMLRSVVRRLASERQRALSERDEARAQAAVMRERLKEHMIAESPEPETAGQMTCECGALAATPEQIAHEPECPLSSSAGAGWLSPEEAEDLRTKASLLEIRLSRDAGRLADEVAALIRRHVIDHRSPAGDALLDFRDPPQSERSDRLAVLDAESADLRARLERAEARRFPIMGGPSIPWAMIAPHARQAKSNHDQSLERLAERGGLSPLEAVAVLESHSWRDVRGMYETEALSRLKSLLSAWESAQAAAEVRRAVEEEREACAAMLRARVRGWGLDTAVGHALDVAARDIRARGKG